MIALVFRAVNPSSRTPCGYLRVLLLALVATSVTSLPMAIAHDAPSPPPSTNQSLTEQPTPATLTPGSTQSARTSQAPTPTPALAPSTPSPQSASPGAKTSATPLRNSSTSAAPTPPSNTTTTPLKEASPAPSATPSPQTTPPSPPPPQNRASEPTSTVETSSQKEESQRAMSQGAEIVLVVVLIIGGSLAVAGLVAVFNRKRNLRKKGGNGLNPENVSVTESNTVVNATASMYRQSDEQTTISGRSHRSAKSNKSNVNWL